MSIIHPVWCLLKKRVQQSKETLVLLNWLAIANVIVFCIVSLPYLKAILSSHTLFIYQGTTHETLPFYEAIVLLFGLSTAYLGQCALLAYIPFLILAPLSLLLQRHRFIIALAILLSSITLIILLVDIKIFLTYHFHLNFKVIPAVNRTDISNTEWGWIAAICTFIVIAQTVLVYCLQRYLTPRKKAAAFAELFVYIWPIVLLTSYSVYIGSKRLHLSTLTHHTPALPLYNQLFSFFVDHSFIDLDVSFASEASFSQPKLPNDTLFYPKHPLVLNASDKKPYNIVMIVIDAWRFDALNATLTPNMTKFAKEAWHFQNHYSGGNSTEAGITSLLYGLPHLYWESLKTAKQGAILINSIRDQGYQTKILFSAPMVPRFNQTAFAQMKDIRLQAAPGKTIPDRDRSLTKEWHQFIQNRDKQKPFFTFTLYDAAHTYCSEQNFEKKIYPNTMSDCYRVVFNKENIQKIYHRYQNAVYFLDEQIGVILQTLKTQKLLDNTIVIITGDHGEEFADTASNDSGHASNYSIFQVKVPFIMYWPRTKPRVWAHITSHYDVVPTLMREVLHYQNPFKDYSLNGAILWDTHAKKDYILAGSYVNTAILEIKKGRHTALLASGNIEINDMYNRRIPDAAVNTELLAQALDDLRWFYQAPAKNSI